MAVRLLLGNANERSVQRRVAARLVLGPRRPHALASSKTLAKTPGVVEERVGHRASIDRFAAARGSVLAVCSLPCACCPVPTPTPTGGRLGFSLAAPMSHTARQALTIFQQWLTIEFKDTWREFKRRGKTSNSVNQQWLDHLDLLHFLDQLKPNLFSPFH